MLSSKEQTQKRMLGQKSIPFKNAKLSVAHIANRSPTNRFQNKIPITTNTLQSKKQHLQSSSKNYIQPLSPTAPIQSLQYTEKSPRYQADQQSRGNIVAEKSAKNVQSSIPQRYEVRQPIINRNVEELAQIGNIQFGAEGNISITLPNGDKYTGQFLNKKYNGNGQYYFKKANLTYRGQFLDGKQHGYGVLQNTTTGDIIYEGDWKEQMKNGRGKYYYSSDQYYNGEWLNDQKHGKGYFSFRGGNYNGQWAMNRPSGQGKLNTNDKTEFSGTFQNNQFKKGTVKYPNGDWYQGSMFRNMRNGQQCKYYHQKQQMRYKGGYKDDKKHGKGTITYKNGDELTGTFRNGLLDEAQVVKLIWQDKTVFNGWLKNGQPDKGTVTEPGGKPKQI